MAFTHLRTTSAYSLDRGVMLLPKIFELAKKNNQSAVAVTDDHKTLAVIQHYIQANKAELKPIVGASVNIETDITQPDRADTGNLLLIVKNETGYRNLNKLLGLSYRNHAIGKPAIKESWLKENSEGLICVSGSFKEGHLPKLCVDVLQEQEAHIKELKKEQLYQSLDFYKSIFNEDFFLEIQRYGLPNEDFIISSYLKLSDRYQIPIVATHQIEFAEREDFILNEIRSADAHEQKIYDVNRVEQSTPENYWRSEEEMRKVFKGLEFALDNTQAIVDRCDLQLELGNNYLPRFSVPLTPDQESSLQKSEDKDKLQEQFEIDYFIQLSREGLAKRLEQDFPDPSEREEKRAIYEKRLQTEIDVIVRMGFSGYFLIVQDFINWAKNNKIPVGPGRGSGAGSLVGYALKITNIDPIRHKLFFERFLNPERVSMPDFDIDFPQNTRQEVVKYIRRKYGEDYTSQILALGYSQPKALLKSVARTLSIPSYIVDKLNKNVTQEETSKDLDYIYKNNTNFRHMIDSDETLTQLFQIARRFDTLPTTIGLHAAGVNITSKPMTDFAATYVTNNGAELTMVDKDDGEKLGLVKFDILGIKTLDIIDDTLKNIKKDKGIEIDIDNIDLDNKEVIQNIFNKRNMFGVFQFEGGGMQRATMDLKPNTFEDLSAMTALFRPGPIQGGLMKNFQDRKNGLEQVAYPLPDLQHESLKPILGNTYGVFIYQEQIMQAAQALAGYTLGGADLLRRAMGKKKPEEMAKQRETFISGCKNNNIDEHLASGLFDMIEKFSGYGFNKSHSVAYTVLSMQCAYLKHYHPAYFLANNYNYQTDNLRKELAIEDIRRQGIELCPPNINKSLLETSAHDDKIFFGFHGVKGNKAPYQAIVEEREKNGEFTSFINFYQRCYPFVTKTAVENLIKIGAFDDLHPNQRELVENVAKFQKVADKLKRRIKTLGSDEATNLLLGGSDYQKLPKEFEAVECVSSPDYTLLEKALNELEILGINVNNDPVQGYIESFQGLKALSTVGDVKNLNIDSDEKNNMPIMFSGVITDVRQTKKKTGKMITIMGAKAQVDNEDYGEEILLEEAEETEDNEAQLKQRSITFFVKNEILQENPEIFKENAFVGIAGRVSKPSAGYEENSFWLEKIYSEDELRSLLAEEVSLFVEPQNIQKLQEVLTRHRGNRPVTIFIPNKENSKLFSSRLAKEFFVNGTVECLRDLKENFGEKAVSLNYKQRYIVELDDNNRRGYNQRRI